MPDEPVQVKVERVYLKVTMPGAIFGTFRLKVFVKIGKLKRVYARCAGITDIENLKFHFNGALLDDEARAETFNFDNYDEIIATMEVPPPTAPNDE